MPDQGSVSITWQTADQTKVGTITVHADGVALDDAVELVADGAELRGYTVSRTRIVEQVTRPGRDRRPARERVQAVQVAEGEPAAVRSARVKGGRVDG